MRWGLGAVGSVLRSLGGAAAAGAAPGEPTLSIVLAGSGAITATVDGDASITNTLYYRQSGDTSWTEGNNRNGDGDISATGLDADTNYTFVVVSDDSGFYSVPSAALTMLITGDTQHTYNILAIMTPEERGDGMQILATEVD